MLTIDLTGRVTVVIGGSRGIGAGVVRRAVECGSHSAWTAIDEGESASLEEAARAAGVKARHAILDCTDAAATASFLDKLAADWGGIDHLVYSAGLTNPKALLDIAPAEWRRLVDINLGGAFFAVRSAAAHMKSGAAIVLIGSAAFVAGGGGRADYAAAKAGLEGLNRAVARELGPKGIRCNLVHPSLIDTDLLRQRHPDAAKRTELAAAVPLRRLGTADDIAFATLFLLSDLAGYVTAQSLFVDGGRTFCRS